jgi:TIR domain/Protein of unknown function (DUF3298)
MAADLPLIFISYANPDRPRVTPYFEHLENCGFNVWIDYKRIVAGQNWDFEIRKALDTAALVVVFFSNNSVDRRGYVQREIKLALDKAEEKLTGDIYIIPVLLDEATEIPGQVESIQCVKAWKDDSHDAIKNAINHQLAAIGIEVRAAQERANLTWTQTLYKEAWKGLPGYEVELKLLRFSSTEYSNLEDINLILHGELVSLLVEMRKAKFIQEPDRMSFGQNEYWRTNTLSAYSIDPIITHRILSIHYNIHTCNAGAAHPYAYFKTYAFFLDPVVRIQSLKDIFDDPSEEALKVLQSSVREQLLVPKSPTENEEPISLDPHWVEEGTKDWKNFHAFVFKKDGIEILFAPYEVDCYAGGPHSVMLSYQRLLSLMRIEYLHALDLPYWEKGRNKGNSV